MSLITWVWNTSSFYSQENIYWDCNLLLLKCLLEVSSKTVRVLFFLKIIILRTIQVFYFFLRSYVSRNAFISSKFSLIYSFYVVLSFYCFCCIPDNTFGSCLHFTDTYILFLGSFWFFKSTCSFLVFSSN